MSHRRVSYDIMRENVAKVAAMATSDDITHGLAWYNKANYIARKMASKYGLKTWQVAGVIAALSPGNPWDKNVYDADSLLRAWRSNAPLPLVGSYGWLNIEKARRILQGERPLDVLPKTGPKTRAFFTLINNPRHKSAVCIDRHAKGAAIGARAEKETVVRAYEYPRYVRVYHDLAHLMDGEISGAQLQAIVWVTWKRLGREDKGHGTENSARD